MRKSISLLIVSLTFFISACATNPPNLPSVDQLLRESTNQDGRACIRQSDIRGWGSLDDNVISVNTSGNRNYYLVTTLYRCNSIFTSHKAGFESSSYEICGGGLDDVVTTEESCPIKGIFKFDDRESAFAAFDEAEKQISTLKQQHKEDSK